MSELEQVTALCARLGAPPGQAAVMARQLLKRAEQIAAARSIERNVALAQLLDVVVRGRSGEGPKPSPDGRRVE